MPRISRFVSFLFLFGIGAGVCLAPQPPPQPNSRERARRAEAYIRDRLAVWQSRLKLGEWKIAVVLSHPNELRRGTTGNIRWDAAKKTARIRVLHSASYERPIRETLEDMEFTVVHELIHLQLSSLPRSEASRTDEEHAVNRMTEALLELDRAN